MPRRSRSPDNDDELPAPRRRSQRISEKYKDDDENPLKYDTKYHPSDEQLKPATARARRKVHGLSIEISSGSDDSDVTEVEMDDDSGAFHGSRKRRSTSSTASKSKRRRSDFGDGMRCSTLKNIETMSEKYNQAWETSIKNLSPSEQLGYHATQYENAWEAWATQHGDPQKDEDTSLGNIDFDYERDEDNNINHDHQPHNNVNAATKPPVRSDTEPRRTQSNDSTIKQYINEEMFQSSHRSHGSQRSSAHFSQESRSVDESFHQAMNDQEEQDLATAPRVHVVSSPGPSSASRSHSPDLRPTKPHPPATSTSRSRKKDDFAIYEDNGLIGGALSTWSQRNLDRQSLNVQDEAKENNDVEEDLPEHGLSLDGTSSQRQRITVQASQVRHLGGSQAQRSTGYTRSRVIDDSDEEDGLQDDEQVNDTKVSSKTVRTKSSKSGPQDEDEDNEEEEDEENEDENGHKDGSDEPMNVQQVMDIPADLPSLQQARAQFKNMVNEMRKAALRGDTIVPHPVYGIPPSIQAILDTRHNEDACSEFGGW